MLGKRPQPDVTGSSEATQPPKKGRKKPPSLDMGRPQAEGRTPSIQLPAHLDIEQELSTYYSEIQALHKAINASANSSSVRAWQMLPRHRRRRNASHNLLALPKRLRGKGRAEMRASNTLPRSKSDIRRRKGRGSRAALGAYPRSKQGKRRAILIGRATQAAATGKAWMESHLWHAKRFRMSGREGKWKDGKEVPGTYRWGFSLPEESSMKSFRASWRDDKNGATIIDKSYEAWFRISASPKQESPSSREDGRHSHLAVFLYILEKCGIPVDEIHKRDWTTKPFLDTIFTVVKEETKKARGPVQVHFVDANHHTLTSYILLRTHPGCSAQLERALRRAKFMGSKAMDQSYKLQFSKLNTVPHPLFSAGSSSSGRQHNVRSNPGSGRGLRSTLHDMEEALARRWMRNEGYNVFEVAGPKSGHLLSRVLRPIGSNAGDPRCITTMKDYQRISMRVHDPRLSFPPKALTAKDRRGGFKVSGQPSELFVKGAYPPRYSKGEIDSRRAKLPVSGARLLPTSRDDKVPIIVLCRVSAFGRKTYTVIVPRGWSGAFWLSLVHPGTRVLGQSQLHSLQFDKKIPTFPYDWAGTPAFEQWASVDSLKAYEAWRRTPPAKRFNPATSGVRWCFGGPGLWREIVKSGKSCKGFSEIYTSRNGTEEKSDDTKICRADSVQIFQEPWLFVDPSQSYISDLCEVIGSHHSSKSYLLQVLSSALVCVKLTACRRGTFSKWDEVHLMDYENSKSWYDALRQVQNDRNARGSVQILESKGVPTSSSLVGAVTTGHFTLSEGKTTALASMSLIAFLELKLRRFPTLHMEEPVRNPVPLSSLVIVRSPLGGGMCRAASVELISLF